MKTSYTLILTILFTICYSKTNAQTAASNEKDTIQQFISVMHSAKKISKSPLLVIDGIPKEYKTYKRESQHLSKTDVEKIYCLEKKNKTATNIYGKKGKGGVLLIITTKARKQSPGITDERKVLYLIGDREISKNELNHINPDDIQAIRVLKEKSDVKKITDEKYDGVVIITMKDSKSQK